MLRLAPVLAVMAIGCGRIGFDDVTDAAATTGPTFDVDFTAQQLAGVQVRRASIGTYVDATGVIRTAAADEPRFDHDPMTGAPRGLLIEGSRTNGLALSEELEIEPRWFSNGNMTAVANTALAPDGTLTADELVDQDTMGFARRGAGVTVGDDALPYTYSVFVRAGTLSTCSFSAELLQGAPTIQTTMDIDLATGTITTPPPLASSYGLERYAGGWMRVWITLDNNATGNVEAIISLWADRSGPATPTGSYYAWGAQLEQAPTPTSYIPTTTDAVTRMADVVTTTDVSWLRAARGTLRVIARAEPQRPLQPALCVRGTATTLHCLRRGGGTHELLTPSRVLVGGAWPASDARTMIALWDDDELALWDEAIGLTSAAITSDRSATQVVFGSDGSAFLDGHLVRVTHWPERIANAELPTLP